MNRSRSRYTGTYQFQFTIFIQKVAKWTYCFSQEENCAQHKIHEVVWMHKGEQFAQECTHFARKIENPLPRYHYFGKNGYQVNQGASADLLQETR